MDGPKEGVYVKNDEYCGNYADEGPEKRGFAAPNE
jgi:hypothetical protein